MMSTAIIIVSPPNVTARLSRKFYYRPTVGDATVSRSLYVKRPVAARFLARGVINSRPSEDSIFLNLSPLERCRYLAKHKRGEFILCLVALISGLYFAVTAAISLRLSFVSSAWAQSAAPVKGFMGLSWATVEDSVLGLLGVAFICCFGIIMCAKMITKINFAKDFVRKLLPFFLGYVSGKGLH